ncbi:alpha/beta hydrolase family protein [Prevotella sp. E13-27]|uniref:alpha/beta hydrolase family protein n=1 Tax=Prevotella sp. E13-27 TaxID=2938122 RepID=UPI002009DD25|nr:prolyl oligopeptidase family serine peptidase [Prevotella sp. E13-27]MCK8622575.1 prolyl oligopeptidase family serine peptidase [Prevotella sp. E13-27]
MKKAAFLCLSMLPLLAISQHETEVKEFNLTGPFAVSAPVCADTADLNGKHFDDTSILNGLRLTSASTTTYNGALLPSLPEQKGVGILSFYINNTSYLKGKLSVNGAKKYKLFIDGTESSGELKLAPEHHTIAIKFLAEPSDTDSIKVTIDAPSAINYTLDKRHPYMVHDLTDGRRVRGINISADGAFVTLSFQTTERGGKSRWEYELRDTKKGQLVRTLTQNVTWMPKSCAYIEEVWEGDKRVLYKVDALSGERTRLAYDLPSGYYALSPTEDYLIITGEEDGPKEDEEVFEVLEMDDRQPGWRKRSFLQRYDLASGLCQRLTFGSHSQYLHDISADGKKLLIGSSYSRLSRRPTEVVDVTILDLTTLKADTIIKGEGFLGSFHFSPDGKQLLVTGTPEAFNRIGCQLPASVIPNMIEKELFLFDIATKAVTPLTKDFNPSITNVTWANESNMIFFSAEDRDYVRLYQLNPSNGKITQLEIAGDYAYRFDVANNSNQICYLSYETMAPASAYLAYTAKGKSAMKQIRLFDGHTALGDAELGTCKDWNFTNSRGDTVYGRLYLPKDFDATKKYPMIVYYYGGCSPVSRYFESPYAPQYWNSLGYVAYILQPSGATGFGQEWASRHVNTAGHGPAEDIIEGTKQICKEHQFIDASKIGCMGASYGGFMTQYLQTQTDIFAAAVSHAGIANHTSYWGEGYWGYNYSEVSMAESYPWSHRKLYVEQSPLFNADKIHTPLLLLHGTDDTNVPIIESLQMFTALKLLGREVALVEVKGENHHILDYRKREKWLATQMAWFQKWLKGDSSWWDALYPKKNL